MKTVKQSHRCWVCATDHHTDMGNIVPHQNRIFDEGEPCGHPGCLSHITHPCEGCSRVGGKTEKQINDAYREANLIYWFAFREASRRCIEDGMTDTDEIKTHAGAFADEVREELLRYILDDECNRPVSAFVGRIRCRTQELLHSTPDLTRGKAFLQAALEETSKEGEIKC